MKSDLSNIFYDRQTGHQHGRDYSAFHEVRNNKKYKSRGIDRHTRESMRERHSSGKRSGINFQLLVRVLNANVGRNWNDVYSDICQVFPKNKDSTWQLHNWILDSYVDRQRKMFVCQAERDFYVDVDTNILSKSITEFSKDRARHRQHRAKLIAEEHKLVRFINNKILLQRETETSPWFICELRQVPEFRRILVDPEAPLGTGFEYDAFNSKYVEFNRHTRKIDGEQDKQKSSKLLLKLMKNIQVNRKYS